MCSEKFKAYLCIESVTVLEFLTLVEFVLNRIILLEIRRERIIKLIFQGEVFHAKFPICRHVFDTRFQTPFPFQVIYNYNFQTRVKKHPLSGSKGHALPENFDY